MIERLTGANAVSGRALSEETGVAQETLSRWLRDANSLPGVEIKKRKRHWSIDEKIRVLSDASKTSGADLPALLEREGLQRAELEQWRLALSNDLGGSVTVTRQLRKVERELARKDKALAEAAALLILKKKWAICGRDEVDDTEPEKDELAEAQAAGARLGAACKLVGLSQRTVERWRLDPNASDKRQGPRHRPDNGLPERTGSGHCRDARPEVRGHLAQAARPWACG